MTLNGTYWTGSASAVDTWTLQNSATNGLTISHTGNPGSSSLNITATLNLTSAVQAAEGFFGFSAGAVGSTFAISAAGTASAGLTTYTATITAGAVPSIGQYVTVAGFVTHTSNNGRFIVSSATTGSVVLFNAAGVAETHSATGTVDGDYRSQANYDVALAYNTTFPIFGTARNVSGGFEALPYDAGVTLTAKGDATDAGYLRITNDGTTGNHGLEIGGIIDGTGVAPVTLKLGVNSGISSASFNAPVILPGAIVPATVISFSTTPTFTAALGSALQLTLTGNVSSSTLSGAVAGEFILFRILEDGAGSHTFVWPTNVKGAMDIVTTANTVNQQLFYYDGTNAYAVAPGTWV